MFQIVTECDVRALSVLLYFQPQSWCLFTVHRGYNCRTQPCHCSESGNPVLSSASLWKWQYFYYWLCLSCHWFYVIHVYIILHKATKFSICMSASPLPSAWQHPSYGDCLEVKREYYQNSYVLDCVTQCSQSAAHLYEEFLQVQQIAFVTLGP